MTHPISDDPVRATWSAQPDVGGQVDLVRASGAVQQRESAARKRDRIMYACAAIIAPSWAAIMWLVPDLRLVAAFGFVVAVWVAAQLYWRSAARLTPLSTARTCADYQVALLSRERDLYLTMPFWYLVPVGLSQVAIFIAFWTSPRLPRTAVLLFGAALFVGSTTAVLLVARRRWQRQAAELQRELDTLNVLRNGDRLFTTGA